MKRNNNFFSYTNLYPYDEVEIINLQKDIKEILDLIISYESIKELFNLFFKEDIYFLKDNLSNDFTELFHLRKELKAFFNTINFYRKKFIKHIYTEIFKMEYPETLLIEAIEEIWNFQLKISYEIFKHLLLFENSLRNFLLIVFIKYNLSFDKLKINISKITEKKFINDASKDNLEDEQKNLDLIFEELIFNDYLKIIRKLDQEQFLFFMNLIHEQKNQDNSYFKNEVDYHEMYINVYKFNSENELNKKDLIKKLNEIKKLRNKISHGKTIIFNNWFENDNYFNLKESVQILKDFSYEKEELQKGGLNWNLIREIEILNKKLNNLIPSKINEINDYFKKMF